MAAQVVGLSGTKWGTHDEPAMILESIEVSRGGRRTDLSDGAGNLVQFVFDEDLETLSANFTIKDSANAPDRDLRGSQFSLANDSEFSGTYWVDEVRRSRAKGQHMQGSLTAVRMPAAGATTTTTTTTA